MKTLKFKLLLFLVTLLPLMAFNKKTEHPPEKKVNFQLNKFDGYWAGVIAQVDNEEDTQACMILIKDGDAVQLTFNKETKQLEPLKHTKENTVLLQNNLSFTWMNNSSVWSENQSFMMSYLSDKALQLVWLRQVNNIKENENEEWHVIRSGKLKRYTKKELEDILKG